jgi:hypothetical protein
MKNKKATLFGFFITIILLIALTVTAVASGNISKWFKQSSASDAYTFPEYDGDGPLYWDDAVEFYQVPEELLTSMSTEGLIETCLEYPLFASQITTSNVSMYSGFMDTRKQFNGIAELFKREDAASKLIEVYTTSKLSDITSSDSYSTLRMKYLEYMIAQDEILLSLTKSERSELLEFCINRFDTVRKEYDSFFPPDSTILIVSKILTEDNASFKELVEEYPGIETFNRDGVIDQGTLDSIETIIDFIDKEGGF